MTDLYLCRKVGWNYLLEKADGWKHRIICITSLLVNTIRTVIRRHLVPE
jgi:hypothetical protein